MTAPGAITCAGPLVWSEGVPERGHYCFIGFLRNTQDPGPDLASVTDSNSFYDLIRLNNNVVWKNFDVENLFAGGYARVEFQIQGWPRHAMKGDLEINLSALPAGMDAEFRLVRRLVQGASLEGMVKIAESKLYSKLKPAAGAVSAIRMMPLLPSDNTEGILQLTVSEDIPDGVYDISIRQLVDGAELGRITRRLALGRHPFTANRNTGEIHISNCQWIGKMSGRNKVAYLETDLAIRHGFNGCRYCLPELSTD